MKGSLLSSAEDGLQGLRSRQKQEDQLEGYEKIQTRNDVNFDQEDDSTGTEKWSNCGYVLKAEPTEFADTYRGKGFKA